MKHLYFIIFLVLFAIISINAQQIRLLSNCESLQSVLTNDLSAKYELNSDLDCSSIENFIPIGDLDNPFKGSIDGKNHKIKNLKIECNNREAGLIAFGQSASISNLIFEDINITSNFAHIGALFGISEGCNVENVTLTTSSESNMNIIKGTSVNVNIYIGGISGYISDSNYNNIIIKNSFVDGEGYERVGGVVGKLCFFNSYFLNYFHIIPFIKKI